MLLRKQQLVFRSSTIVALAVLLIQMLQSVSSVIVYTFSRIYYFAESIRVGCLQYFQRLYYAIVNSSCTRLCFTEC